MQTKERSSKRYNINSMMMDELEEGIREYEDNKKGQCNNLINKRVMKNDCMIDEFEEK